MLHPRPNRLKNTHRFSLSCHLLAFLLLLCTLGGAAEPAATVKVQPITAVPAAENLAARRSVFAERNSPAQVDSIGSDFFARTYIPTWDLKEFNRPNGWATLKEIRAQIDGKNFHAGLDLFRNYTLEKLRGIDTFGGIPRGRFDPFSTGVVGLQWIRPLMESSKKDETVKLADEILNGVVLVNNKRLNVGEPGTVNWKALMAAGDGRSAGFDLDSFYPLLAAYIFSGEQRYIERWAAYADDWAMNQHEGMASTNIADVPDEWINGVETMLNFLRYLGGVAALPNGAADLPSTTLARLFSRLIDDYIPISIIYHRSNPQNWNDASLPATADVGFFMEDFPIGRQLVQEARRRLDLLSSTHHLLDGTELDSTVGYSNLYIIGAGSFLNRIDTRNYLIPEWMLTPWEKADWRNDPGVGHWQQTVRGEMLKRGRTLVAHSLGSGEWPIGGSRNSRNNDSDRLYSVLRYFLPDAFQDPDVANIMALSTGRRANSEPSFTSERLPYGGHAYIRDGWGPEDPYLYMYAAPYPLSGALSVRNNNAIGIGAYGCDLIETGENGVYDRPRTPVKVDGLDQHYPFGVQSWGHRGQMLTTSGYNAPPNWRWHASSSFNVCEGVYAGNFGADKKLDDVNHQRMVQYVRGAGLWIITDRLKSPQPHTYTLDWRFGVKPGHESDFTADQITFQPDQSTIKTVRPGGANVSLYQFSSTPLTMTSGEERTPPKGYRLHDFVRISNDWKAQGESVIVTAIYPRKTQEEELTAIKSLNVAGAEGFEASTQGGSHVLFQSATVAPGALNLPGLSGNAESLLLVTDKAGIRRGVALGCKTLLCGGKPVVIPSADFEFEFTGPQMKTMPIYTPLFPVQISPSDTTAFIGEINVSLKSGSPGCEIRYTLDGSEPTPASPLYTAPVNLKTTTTIKARSVRPGLTALPTTMSGTLASVVTEALYDAVTPAKRANPQPSIAGLKYDYYEGRWQELLCATDRNKPVKSGTVEKLFDVSQRGSSPTFAFRYTGFFEAPVDGVYNFYAPPEYYEPSIMAGYELRLSMNDKEWYPATSRHALGTWSVALAKGQHRFSVYYADLRADAVKKINKPGLKPIVWDAAAPVVQLSGPGIPKGPIPESFLTRVP